MQVHPNRTHAHEAPVDGVMRTPYTRVVCVVCGHERIRAARQQASCPQCGGNARRAFALFRDLREEQ